VTRSADIPVGGTASNLGTVLFTSPAHRHAPGEPLLAALARHALRPMAGLLWDIGEQPCP
jgi:hypothetical protein